jgi:hypothetical protein
MSGGGFIAMPSMQDVERLERRITLLERQARLPELREELAMSVDHHVMIAAALEANDRTGKQLAADTAGAFAQIVVDVINRNRS